MKKLFSLSVLAALIIVASIGCQNGPSPIEADFSAAPQALKFVPDGAALESADFHIFVSRPNSQDIFVHRITSDWDEMTVTHNSFGGAFDTAPAGSFNADGTGYKTVDVTSLVADWSDGTFENFGLLLDQDGFNTPRAIFYSKDYSGNHPPLLTVCYSIDNETVCDTLIAIADTYIWEIHPDSNYGGKDNLFTGWVAENDFEKQTLVRFFSEENPPMEGCTRTIGYWKTHAGFGPQDDVLSQYLPITLGEGGGESVVVENAATAVAIFTMGKNNAKNGIHKLMAQLLAAKLNIAAGADFSDISDFIEDADGFLTNHNAGDWDSLSEYLQDYVLELKSVFDDYNNGIIGPGHCDDGGDNDCDNDGDHHRKTSQHKKFKRHHKDHHRGHHNCR